MYGFCMIWGHIENVNVSSPQKTYKAKKKNILLIVKYFKGIFLGDLSRETKSEIKKTNTDGTHNIYMHIYTQAIKINLIEWHMKISSVYNHAILLNE